MWIKQLLREIARWKKDEIHAEGCEMWVTYLGLFGIGAIAGILFTYTSVNVLFWTLAGIASIATGIGLFLAGK